MLRQSVKENSYRTRAIITRGLYILNPLFENQKRFLRGFVHKILHSCMVSIQKRAYGI